MKRSFAVVCVIFGIISGFMVGCTHSKAMNEECFKVLFTENHGNVVYDTRTGVEYWMSIEQGNVGTLTLLVDEDGKPLVYED